jgi:hypothetical protein
MNPPLAGGEVTVPDSAWWAGKPITADLAHAWVEKGRRCAAPLLELAGQTADPAMVVPRVVPSSDEWLYGNFMLAWLDSSTDPRSVRHLPDGSFFLHLLRLAYAPVLKGRPDLSALLTDTSRPEMSLTNDVLQIQLRGREEGYSMIRHHALMLFYAALWLDEPKRSQWLDLYDELVTYIDERPGGRPSLSHVAAVEAGAFEDFVELAPRTLTATDAQALFDDPSLLDRIVEYQLYAGVAIGLLWREYRTIPEHDREAWQREQLSERYLRLDYLEQNWKSHR